jgi:ABC-type cobalamin/Fe3+-siderophores transport system ATPase subunit
VQQDMDVVIARALARQIKIFLLDASVAGPDLCRQLEIMNVSHVLMLKDGGVRGLSTPIAWGNF